MSEAKQEVPVLSLLDQLRQQHAAFIQQKDIAQNNLNQLVGAIFACDLMIKKHEAEEAKKGDQGNGEAINEEQGQTPQE